jgi:hypothetical protein
MGPESDILFVRWLKPMLFITGRGDAFILRLASNGKFASAMFGLYPYNYTAIHFVFIHALYILPFPKETIPLSKINIFTK